MNMQIGESTTNPVIDTKINVSVFISYSHDSDDHSKMVLELADRLVSHGIDCILDQYEQSPPDGWVKWMARNIDASNYILVVCTEPYAQRANGESPAGCGKGVKFESLLTYQELYDNDSIGNKFIPVLLRNEDAAHIPKPLRPFQRYLVADDYGYEDLYRRITSQPRIVKPSPGKRQSLPTGENLNHINRNKDIENIALETPAKAADASLVAKLVELRLDKEFKNFSVEDQNNLLRAIAELLKLSDSDLRIKRIREGSVKILLELPPSAATLLLKLFGEGKLKALLVTDATEVSHQFKVGNLTTKSRVAATGTVKWFNDATGFGFVTPDDGSEELFAHFSAINMSGFKSLKEGQKVEFERVTGEKGYEAKIISTHVGSSH